MSNMTATQIVSAFVEGKRVQKRIRCIASDGTDRPAWVDLEEPVFDFAHFEYRVYTEPPNWVKIGIDLLASFNNREDKIPKGIVHSKAFDCCYYLICGYDVDIVKPTLMNIFKLCSQIRSCYKTSKRGNERLQLIKIKDITQQ